MKNFFAELRALVAERRSRPPKRQFASYSGLVLSRPGASSQAKIRHVGLVVFGLDIDGNRRGR